MKNNLKSRRIGCHVSIAGGIWNAPKQAREFGCEVFQMFSRSPQGGKPSPLNKTNLDKFFAALKEYGFNPGGYVIHCPYYINLASGNPTTIKNSIRIIREELERATLLKAQYIMAHMGSAKEVGEEKGVKLVSNAITQILKGYRGTAQFLIEMSAGAGAVIGDTFEEVTLILNHIKVDKSTLSPGICFDTQHAFGSGYDLRTPEAVHKTFKEFDRKIGIDKLKMAHCNDSMVELGSHRDRHEHIGKGKIGLSGFKALLNEPMLKHINWYAETEHDKVVEDIKLLKKLRG
ncbi:MAG: deoxyribonuclease IV [Candidatus Magasanikbacteria bacterium]|nr:deoxyribonuclease IV [Candidatus Magasanikbacteria bacterium]